MKIIVIAHFQNDGSPNAIYIHNQIKALAKRGNCIRVVVPVPFFKKDYYGKRMSAVVKMDYIDEIEYYFIRVVSLSNYGEKAANSCFSKLAIRHNFKKVLENFTPDIIHVHTFGADTDMALEIKNKINTPCIITTHGTDLEKSILTNKNRLLKNIKDSDAIITVSEKLERKIKNLNSECYVKTIYNGCDINVIENVKKKKHSFVYVGALIKQKKVDVVIKTIFKLINIMPDISLKIVGDGLERKNLQDICIDYGINEKVEFLGKLPNKKVLEIMSESEYFIMPSVNEGFGIVYIEAMASGCITIGTRGEGIDGFIIDGENGFLVNSNSENIVDIILKCERNDELKNTVVNNAKKDARCLTWDKNAEENIKLYTQLVNTQDR